MRPPAVLSVAVAVVAAATLALTANIAAGIQGIAVTEPVDPYLATALEAANGVRQDLAVVLMKDRQFLPDIVHLQTGGTVIFVWADSEKREHHSPQSSGSTGSAAIDLSGDYIPPNPSACFNSAADLGVPDIVGEGAHYPLTLQFDAGAQRIHKSMGYLSGTPVGDLSGAEAFRVCPAGTHSGQGGSAVVPFFCLLHGKDFGGEKGEMKGAIILAP